MTARRGAFQPLPGPRAPESGKAAIERFTDNNAVWSFPSPAQDPERESAFAAGIHANVVGVAVAGSGAADESSDSEAEQEGPQKLIRKVSTSGQIRSKVIHRVSCLFVVRVNTWGSAWT